MPKIDPDILKDFGRAVKRARTLKTWDQPTLGGKFEPAVGASFISKVEKGRKEALNSRTVGRFINALDLDQGWIDKFLDAEESAEAEETKAEREADKVIARLKREGATEGTTDDLLIQLANNFTEGDHKDTETAYRSVRAALETLQANKNISALAGNADAQFAAIMEEVDALNADAEFDLAAERLEEQAKALEQEKERLTRLAELQLEKELSQDRLRNRPDLAAKRLITDIERQAPAGGVFRAVDRLAFEWIEDGDKAGDMFALRAALAMSKANYERVEGKRPLAAAALATMGWCQFRLAERSSNEGHLKAAKNASQAALDRTNKREEPENWATRSDRLGATLQEIGRRNEDPTILQLAVEAHGNALSMRKKTQSDYIRYTWNGLGIALQTLGEFTRDADMLREAEQALSTALAQKGRDADPIDWGLTQNNLALAQRWLGEVSEDLAKLDEARSGFAACEELEFEGEAPFNWATLNWNIADLALAQFALDPDPKLIEEARDYVGRARDFFVEGSEYQTRRCDELLARIDAAEAGS